MLEVYSNINNYVKCIHLLLASWGEPFDKFPVKGYDRVFDLNLKSLFFITQKYFA